MKEGILIIILRILLFIGIPLCFYISLLLCIELCVYILYSIFLYICMLYIYNVYVAAFQYYINFLLVVIIYRSSLICDIDFISFVLCIICILFYCYVVYLFIDSLELGYKIISIVLYYIFILPYYILLLLKVYNPVFSFVFVYVYTLFGFYIILFIFCMHIFMYIYILIYSRSSILEGMYYFMYGILCGDIKCGNAFLYICIYIFTFYICLFYMYLHVHESHIFIAMVFKYRSNSILKILWLPIYVSFNTHFAVLYILFINYIYISATLIVRLLVDIKYDNVRERIYVVSYKGYNIIIYNFKIFLCNLIILLILLFIRLYINNIFGIGTLYIIICVCLLRILSLFGLLSVHNIYVYVCVYICVVYVLMLLVCI